VASAGVLVVSDGFEVVEADAASVVASAFAYVAGWDGSNDVLVVPPAGSHGAVLAGCVGDLEPSVAVLVDPRPLPAMAPVGIAVIDQAQEALGVAPTG
jgi:hypothetical protein